MQELYEGIELTSEQAEWITRGLLDLAAVDGTHESEMGLISEFYSGSGVTTSLDDLAAKGFDPQQAVAVLGASGPKMVEAFLVSCYLLIYADGEHSEAERRRITEYAEAFGVSHGDMEEIHVKARLYVLQSLAHILWNRDTVKQIGSSMGLSDDYIAKALEK